MYLQDLEVDVQSLKPVQRGALLYVAGDRRTFYSQKHVDTLISLGFVDSQGQLTVTGRMAAAKIASERNNYGKKNRSTQKKSRPAAPRRA